MTASKEYLGGFCVFNLLNYFGVERFLIFTFADNALPPKAIKKPESWKARKLSAKNKYEMFKV
jgi:hypothetical protein